MARTLAELRAEAQQRCNQENKTLVATADWNRYINEAIAELYDEIVASYPHYYNSSFAFSLSSSNLLALSGVTGFYKLRGVDYLTTPSRPVSVRPYNFQERNKFSNLNYQGSYTLWYTPTPTLLVNDPDTPDAILSVWDEFIPVTAAIVGAVKEESFELAQALGIVKAGILARIRQAAPNRDGEPAQAADLMTSPYGYGESGRRYALEGSNLTILGSSVWDWPY